MNDESKMFVKVFAFVSLVLAPLTSVVIIYVYFRDLELGRHPSIKSFIGLEAFFIGGSFFAYWLIKRMGWDFWKKDK